MWSPYQLFFLLLTLYPHKWYPIKEKQKQMKYYSEEKKNILFGYELNMTLRLPAILKNPMNRQIFSEKSQSRA